MCNENAGSNVSDEGSRFRSATMFRRRIGDEKKKKGTKLQKGRMTGKRAGKSRREEKRRRRKR